MVDPLTINRFRRARGKRLRAKIAYIANSLGRDITILDIGGRENYWANVGLENVKSIDLLNYNLDEISNVANSSVFRIRLGDARNLVDYKDCSIDLVHSNSVIEHVGSWLDMQAMAREALRVGFSGWIQTPAWEFPIEPHFKAPFLHWFGQPLRRRMMTMSTAYRGKGLSERRMHVDRINLLSHSELAELFPEKTIYVERFLFLPKSYIVQW